MNERPTPETDAEVNELVTSNTYNMVTASFARRLERERDEAREQIRKLEVENDHNWQANEIAEQAFRERDEAREAAEKAKAFKRVLKDDNAKLRRDLDKAQRDADTFLENFGKTQERAINAERELDEARDDHRFLLREIFNLTQIGDPHPAGLPMKALQAIAEMIDEHLKEARK